MDKYIMSSSPHVRSPETTGTIMRDVIIALLPATAVGVLVFGIGSLFTVLICIASAVLAEVLLQLLMHRKISVGDGSAAVTGLLLALNLPPMDIAFWWIPVLGAFFAIGIVKQCFGGLGHNFVNPALAARAFLVISWPAIMTAFTIPESAAVADAVSSATPLTALKAGGALSPHIDMFLGNIGGCIGETSALALIIGGLYLIARRVIDPRIPIIYIGTVALFTFVAGPSGLFTGNALYHILGGGLMIGAIFMATDYTTSPMSGTGKVIFAAGCGILTSIIRLWGGYPEGVSYSILLMNLTVPLIDRAFVPNLFGGATKMKPIITITVKLLIITIIAGALLGLGYSITKDPIEDQMQNKSNEARFASFPKAVSFEERTEDIPEQYKIIQSVHTALDASGNDIGIAATVITKGYNSGMHLTIGIGTDGVINGVVLGSHSETPGLGAKAADSSFIGQYTGKTTENPLTVVKKPPEKQNEIAAISSATITSKGITQAVNTVIDYYRQVLRGAQ